VIGGGGTGAEKLSASMPRAAWASRKHGMSSSSSLWSRPVVAILDRASGRWWLLQLAGAKSRTYAPDGTCTRLSVLRIVGYGTAVLP